MTAARGWAREHGIHLLARASPKCFSPMVDRPPTHPSWISPDGADLATYRKIHMFDVDVGGVEYRENRAPRPPATKW